MIIILIKGSGLEQLSVVRSASEFVENVDACNLVSGLLIPNIHTVEILEVKN